MKQRASQLNCMMALACCGASALPVNAQTNAAAPMPPAVSAAPRMDAGAPLSLEAFLQQVEENYPKLLSLEVERRAASAKRLEKEGAFDPVFTTGTTTAAFNDGGKQKSYNASEFSLEWLSPLGVKFITGGAFNLGDIKAPLTNTGAGGAYFTGFKIPLLRGLGINEKLAAVRQARLGEPLADALYLQARLELLNKAAADYWDWVAAGRRLKVAQDLLTLAQTRADAIGERVAKGDLPGIDSTEALTAVQQRAGNVQKAQLDLQKTAFKLSLYLWQQDGVPGQVPAADRLPQTQAAPVPLAEDAVKKAGQTALDNRPELKALALNREISRVDLSLARNSRLPSVDVVFSPGIDTGAYSVGNVIKAGVVLSVPLRQRGADGRIADAQLKIRKFTLEETLQRQRIQTEVAAAAASVNNARERYLTVLEEQRLARELEQGERDRFALGDSTLFLVNQREQASAATAVKVIDTQAEYEQALAAFRAVTAQL